MDSMYSVVQIPGPHLTSKPKHPRRQQESQTKYSNSIFSKSTERKISCSVASTAGRLSCRDAPRRHFIISIPWCILVTERENL